MNLSPSLASGVCRLKIGVALGTWSWAASMQAHPGHSLTDHGPLHIVASPYHLAVLALAGGALWSAALLVKRRLPRRLMQAAGAIAFLALALLWPTRG